MKFSICISAYKSTYFRECIESVLKQNYGDFELIILDDCSPECIHSIVREFDDWRITYYRNECNVGAERLVDNWNKCVEFSKGEYLVLLGDDDKIDSEYLSEFAKLIDRFPSLDVYHCRSKIIDHRGDVIMLTPSWPEYEDIYDNIWHRITSKRVQFISDFVYRLDTLKERGGFYYMPLAWGADDISAFIACQTKGIAHTNNPVFNYRSNSLSITSTGDIIKKFEANRQYEKWVMEFLMRPAVAVSNSVIYEDLRKNGPLYLIRRNRNLAIDALKFNYLRNSFLLIRKRKSLKISIGELVLILISALKRKTSRVIYN